MEPGNSTVPAPSSGEDSVLEIESMARRGDAPNESASEEMFIVPKRYDAEEVSNAKEEQSREQPTARTLVLADLCRICATANDHLIPIFEGEGAKHELPDKILKYLPIHVSRDDSLPLQLCYHCAATLLAWHELSEGCLNAERRLLEMRDTLRNRHQCYNAASLDNSEVSVPITTTTTTMTTVTTTVNSADSAQPADQQADEKNEEDTGETEKTNRYCGVRTPFKVFLDTQSAFWKPYRKRCRSRTRRRRRSTTDEQDCDRWTAMDMDRSWLDRSTAIGDPRASDPRNNDPTRRSPDRTPTEEEVVATDHEPHRTRSNDERSQDDRVADDDPTDATMDLANEDKDPEVTPYGGKGSWQKQESFLCAECGKCFKLKDSYLRHMRIHKNERPFTCHVCGKQFRDSGGLTRHLKDVHAKLKNFTCDLCDRSFASKATREDHRRTHTGERPYVCDSCGKTFKSKASLYIHSKLHTDEFPHACSYCGKRFRRRQEVLAHVTTHTGEKNHECDVCAKKFRVKSELARHKLIHSEEKPFVCVKCGLAFRQKRYLNNHVKSRHSETLR